MNILSINLFVVFVYNVCAANLRLYPRESETREVKLLNGIWNFRIIPMGEDQDMGFTQKWYSQPLQLVIETLYSYINFSNLKNILKQTAY